MVHSHLEIKFASALKLKNPSAKIGFYGPFASEFPENYLPVCDFVIKGEAEEVFDNFCKGVLELDGLVVSSRDVDVTKLPYPDWQGFDLNGYGYFPALPKKPFLTIQGSRGCPFACDFCPYLVSQGIPLRRRSNDDIVSEIKHLIDTYGIKSLLFRDITWSMHKKLTKELCEKIIENNFQLDIAVETRADTLDDELIRLMGLAGIVAVNLGVESPDDEILLGSGRRPILQDKMHQVIQKLEKNPS
jgi:radical SAM superfamily enzyme YgiQ (UPF0313 family)